MQLQILVAFVLNNLVDENDEETLDNMLDCVKRQVRYFCARAYILSYYICRPTNKYQSFQTRAIK